MMPHLITPQQFTRIAAVGLVVLIAVVAVIHSRRGEDAGVLAPLEHERGGRARLGARALSNDHA